MTTSIRTAFETLKERIGDQALPLLKQLLRTGQVKTYCQDSERLGPMSEMHTDFWVDRTEDEFELIMQEGRTFFQDQDDSDRPVVAEMVIDLKQDDVAILFSFADRSGNSNAAEVQSGSITSTRSGLKRGPKPIHNQEAIWCAAALIVATKGIPNSQEVLIGEILLWFQNEFPEYGLPPSRSTIQEVVQSLTYLHHKKWKPRRVFKNSKLN